MSIKFIDAIHGQVLIPDEFRLIMESSVLSRLRNVRQLGFTLASYPGAVHTRFEHTIGTIAVLIKLMHQFGLEDKDTQRKYIRAAILSEIGIFPLSYSTRSIFNKIGLNKRDIGEKLYQAYLHNELNLSTDERAMIFKSTKCNDEWFLPITNIPEFTYLSPVKLSSTIDYVLRDSYFTGRMIGGFDYRHFKTFGIDSDKYAINSISESLKALHRVIYSLNQIYGDPLRRTLTQILHELILRLDKTKYLDLGKFQNTSVLVKLDDDEFLFQLGKAANDASDNGDKLTFDMYKIITQRVAPRIEDFDVSDIGFFEKENDVNNQEDVKEYITKRTKCQKERIFFIGAPFDLHVGFRMFGKEFKNQAEALQSDFFVKCTGLNPQVLPQTKVKTIHALII